MRGTGPSTTPTLTTTVRTCATYELYVALTVELARHPIGLAAEAAASPAAISKGYLRAMGITPPIDRAPAVPSRLLGIAMSAYYGGRAECRIWRVPMPVRYVDYTSMYPTVFSLFGLWRWVVADHFESVDWTAELQTLLASITRRSLLHQAAWADLAGVFWLDSSRWRPPARPSTVRCRPIPPVRLSLDERAQIP